MFKFLLYLGLFYIISRFVFGNLFNIKVSNFNMHQHFNKHNQEPDGNVSVKEDAKDSKSGKANELGEYVDYEEIK